jgi:hypothetical protein
MGKIMRSRLAIAYRGLIQPSLHPEAKMKDFLFEIVSNKNHSMIDSVEEYFRSRNCLSSIKGENSEAFSAKYWPKAPGVYIIRLNLSRNILYIGMTGKIKGRDAGDLQMSGGKLSHRVTRWTPYVFQKCGEFKDYWECGPTFEASNYAPPKTKSDNYRHHYPMREIEVICIDLSENWRIISPTFLEAFLLQSFIQENKTLPLGNQEI